MDDFIPTPQRETDKAFLMPIEDTFSIAGRGTVVTGRVESGKIKTGEEARPNPSGRERRDEIATRLPRDEWRSLPPPKNYPPASLSMSRRRCGPQVEIVGLRKTISTTVTGVEMCAAARPRGAEPPS